MTLKKLAKTLDKQSLFRLALNLAEKALPIWDNYTDSNTLEYQDTVVGMYHVVRKDILHRALIIVRKEWENPKSRKKEIKQLKAELSEPIVAMQDFDWELPYPVERTFYAVSNLLDMVAGQDITVFRESKIYLVINQTIDALEKAKHLTITEINAILNEYKPE